MRQNIIVFASGSGSNAQRIFEYFQSSENINIASIYCNNPNAFVIHRAKSMDVPCRVFSNNELYNGTVLSELRLLNPSLIVLAGFLCLVPKEIIHAFPHKIINIHPALLPKYGGKGMYGGKVHQSVIANHDQESGITIHFVNEKYDEGDVIFQTTCEISENDTPVSLADKIHQLEYTHFPVVIEGLLKEM
ncbi:MAG: phosphoribosylglycinamide formyltransferase [Bacteroidales bacterium]|nr:phosphoribosylglycinamide formyltransferase [Bacteroidales bacterium]